VRARPSTRRTLTTSLASDGFSNLIRPFAGHSAGLLVLLYMH
jgi:hypothetical protein